MALRRLDKPVWMIVYNEEPHWPTTDAHIRDWNIRMQQFFDHFLKGADNGWDRRPPVLLQIRTVDGFVERAEHEWPLGRTQWTRRYLDARRLELRPDPPEGTATRSYEMRGGGLTFATAPLPSETEITGPLAARLFMASSTADLDVFLTVRVFSPDGDEVLFQGAIDPKTPIAQGWLRASHRKLDAEYSTPERPYHTHDEIQPLEPGQVYQLEVEIWPTCLVVPEGHRIAMTVAGADFDHGLQGARLAHFANELRGCGPFLHEPCDGRPDLCDGTATLYTGGPYESYLLLPVIPGSCA